MKCFLERITELTEKINLENKKCYLLKILTYIITTLSRNLLKYTMNVSQLKRLNSNPKILSSGLLKAYLNQLKERITL